MKNKEIITSLFCALLSLSSLAQTTYAPENISWRVISIANRLNNYNEVSGALVGTKPKKPKQYLLFEKLKSRADQNELFELTNHSNPIVRAYAYWGLVENNSLKVLNVILKNQSDTIMITCKYGSTAKSKRLIEFMTDFIPSYIDKNNIILTPEQNVIIQREHKEWYRIKDKNAGQ